jgi:CO/xanthine dehydrogenase FAD-binding subunit
VVALTGVGEIAYLLRSADSLVGSNGEPDAVARVAGEATTGVEVNGDLLAPAVCRRRLAPVIPRRPLRTALDRAG